MDCIDEICVEKSEICVEESKICDVMYDVDDVTDLGLTAIFNETFVVETNSNIGNIDNSDRPNGYNIMAVLENSMNEIITEELDVSIINEDDESENAENVHDNIEIENDDCNMNEVEEYQNEKK